MYKSFNPDLVHDEIYNVQGIREQTTYDATALKGIATALAGRWDIMPNQSKSAAHNDTAFAELYNSY